MNYTALHYTTIQCTENKWTLHIIPRPGHFYRGNNCECSPLFTIHICLIVIEVCQWYIGFVTVGTTKIYIKYRLWYNVSVPYPKPGLDENTGNLERGVEPRVQHYSVNFENFGNRGLAEEKRINYNKFEITIKQRKSNIKPTYILFLPFDRCYMIIPCYLHSIYKICIIYRMWRW